MDTISNMIIQIKNAGNAGLDQVSLPYSKFKHAIADVLKKEGYIKNIDTKTKKVNKLLVLDLYLNKRSPKINGVKRISKPSKRVYLKSSDIRGVKSGYGSLIVSTSQGVMTGTEAKKAKLGGETLFQIW